MLTTHSHGALVTTSKKKPHHWSLQPIEVYITYFFYKCVIFILQNYHKLFHRSAATSRNKLILYMGIDVWLVFLDNAISVALRSLLYRKVLWPGFEILCTVLHNKMDLHSNLYSTWKQRSYKMDQWSVFLHQYHTEIQKKYSRSNKEKIRLSNI